MSSITILLAIVVIVVTALILHTSKKKMERLHEKPIDHKFIPRGYTIEELAEYDGKKKPYAFVGVKGVIYNASLEWYGPEGPYNAFAGCDSSRQLGKVVVGKDEINADWTRLKPSHLQTLNEWEERFRSKYVPVGWILDPNGEFAKRAAKMDP
ncbi:hypothetical protein AGDE_01446 [Angomonas deanei]|uniref:Cytochrome b5-like Heme/Steroid binding domain containing protein, putative n=1 Tax=Angomonas deanei TaxID=59799 RepID=A0A7G2CR38_9TRYP|nr:hypothetical protein AGDE_01446 [Angomonas deanei]CAD2221849.1 Cytochrome b5-like Heme/Steroid binding domain containing protein, putative [Angomonas deanei]|eukprot:EPY42477.1 hypothetical protein AGDE_01446 [Angomonas deanei]